MLGCCYGNERSSVATNMRPNQHTKKKGCKARLRFYSRGEGDENIVLTYKNEEHNHPILKRTFEQETHVIEKEEERSWLRESKVCHMKAHQVKQMMGAKFGKAQMTVKHIRYMLGKLCDSNDETKDLAIFLEKIEAEGGSVEVLMENDV